MCLSRQDERAHFLEVTSVADADVMSGGSGGQQPHGAVGGGAALAVSRFLAASSEAQSEGGELRGTKLWRRKFVQALEAQSCGGCG